jgi:hypothetical protein
MAVVIFSAGALADSGLHTVRVRTLAVAAGALTLCGVLGGLALGLHLGHAAATDGIDPALGGFVDLDLSQPGSQTLIHEVGLLSGRLIRLEAEAGRLAKRVGASPAENGSGDDAPGPAGAEPAGGPMLPPLVDGGPGFGASLARLDRNLDQLETSLGIVAASVARHDLDRMAFPSRSPIPGVAISSGFGRRPDPFTGRPARHTGFDYPAAYGAPILASAGGRVRYAGPNGAYGKTVEIDHGDGLVTRYGHASKILVRAGDVVLPGQHIADVGSTGRSTGPHVHFEILRDGRAVPPGPYLAHDAS